MTAHTDLNPETWVDEHGDYLYRYAYVRVGSKAVAEDLVQETFLAALKAKDRYDGRSPVRFWLLGILKHKVVDHYRKSSRETSMEEWKENDMEDSLMFKVFGLPEQRSGSWQFNPRKAFEQVEFWGVFSECLSKLRGPLQKAFVLRELEGQSTEGICKDLGVTANNLWVMLHRARAQLKTCLEQNWLRKNEGET